MKTKEEIQALLSIHNAAQEARRAIETELAGMDGEIKSAIGLGRADDVIRLTARKNELPRLLIEASGVEAAHGVAYYAAQRDESYRIADELQTVSIIFQISLVSIL
jgi:hypothetical protein